MRSLVPEVFEFNDRFQVAYRQKDPNPAAEILATSLCGKARRALSGEYIALAAE